VPKAVWTADVTGQVRTGEGLSCDPRTVADADSRFLFSGATRLSTTPIEARPLVERLFQESGLPEALRPDNGAPFAPRLLGPEQALGVVEQARHPPSTPRPGTAGATRGPRAPAPHPESGSYAPP